MTAKGREEKTAPLDVSWIDPTTAEAVNHDGIVRVRPRAGHSGVQFIPAAPVTDARAVVVACSQRSLRLSGRAPENLEGEALPFTIVLERNAQEVVVALPLKALTVKSDDIDANDIARSVIFEEGMLAGFEQLIVSQGDWHIRNTQSGFKSEPAYLALRCQTCGGSTKVSMPHENIQISQFETDGGHVDLNACLAQGIEIIQPQASLMIAQLVSGATIECATLECQNRPQDSRIIAHKELTLVYGAHSCYIESRGSAAIAGSISESTITVSGDTVACRHDRSNYSLPSLEDCLGASLAGDIKLSRLTTKPGAAIGKSSNTPTPASTKRTNGDSPSAPAVLRFGGDLAVTGDIDIPDAVVEVPGRLSCRRLSSSTSNRDDATAGDCSITVGGSLEVDGDVRLACMSLECGSADLKGSLHIEGGDTGLVCRGTFKTLGEVRVEGAIGSPEEPIGHLDAGGSIHCDGNIDAKRLTSGRQQPDSGELRAKQISVGCPDFESTTEIAGRERTGQTGSEEGNGHLVMDCRSDVACESLRVEGDAHIRGAMSSLDPDSGSCHVNWKPKGNSELAIDVKSAPLRLKVEAPSGTSDDSAPVLRVPAQTSLDSLELQSGCLELKTKPDSKNVHAHVSSNEACALEICRLITKNSSYIITSQNHHKFKLAQDSAESTNITLRDGANIEVEIDLPDFSEGFESSSQKPARLRWLNIAHDGDAAVWASIYSTEHPKQDFRRSELSVEVTGLVELRIEKLVVTKLNAQPAEEVDAHSTTGATETTSTGHAGFPTLSIGPSALVRGAAGAAHIKEHEGRLTSYEDNPIRIKSFQGGNGYINRVDPRDIPYENIDSLNKLKVFTPNVKSIKEWRKELLKPATRERSLRYDTGTWRYLYRHRVLGSLLYYVLCELFGLARKSKNVVEEDSQLSSIRSRFRGLFYPSAVSDEARILIEEQSQFFRKLVAIVRRRGIDGRANAELSWTLYRLRHFSVPVRWSFQNLYFWLLRSLGYGCKPIQPLITWFLVSLFYSVCLGFKNATTWLELLWIVIQSTVPHMLRLPLQITSLDSADMLEIAASIATKLAVIAFISALAKYRVFTARQDIM